jgi:hypothetical protein
MKINAPELHGVSLTRLDSLGLIEVSGADAETFLQGQLSNDVRQLSAVRAQLSSYNSPKGRMLAVMHLMRGAGWPAGAAGPGIFLELHRSVLEATLKRLRMFVLRSKVILEDTSTRHGVLGLAGPEAAALLKEIGLPAPGAPLDLAWTDQVVVIRRQGDYARYTIFAALEPLDKLWSALTGKAAVTDGNAWKLLEINAGIPTIYPETSDHFVPQMCNLDTLGGISFSKGCYTGQEIVARVHYRGAVKRRMVTIRLATDPPAPGTRLENGEVVDAAPHPDGGCLALVVVTPDP